MNGIITNATEWRSHKLQGRCKFQGLPISIENERGSYRQGIDAHGKVWRTFMGLKYGYVRATEGVDGDCVDVYIGNNPFSNCVFIIHQNDPVTGNYDEDKIILGVGSPEEAKARYLRQYDRPDYFGSMEEVDMATFKKMLKEGKGIKLKKIGSKKSFSNTRTSHAKSAGNLTDSDPLIEKSKGDVSVKLVGVGKRLRKSPSLEDFVDSGISDSKVPGNFGERSPGLSHSKGGIKIPKMRTTMFSPMNALRRKLEIRNDIVKTVSIAVMDDLSGEQGSSEVALHDNSMLKTLGTATQSNKPILSGSTKSTNMPSRILSAHNNPPVETKCNSSSKNSQDDLGKSKYIRKYFKNGRWNYVYPDNGGTHRPRPLAAHSVVTNLGGTTGGALLVSMVNGEQKVVKGSTGPEHLKEEYTANRIYKILGVPVPSVSLRRTPEGPVQIADFVEGTPLGDLGPEERMDALESLQRGFVADALLGNWDVLGMDEDNILWDGGKAWRIDNGGSMRYRAQGESKGSAFAGTVGEIETMRDPSKGAGRAFSTISDNAIADQVRNVVAHRGSILEAIDDPSLRRIMEARIGSLEGYLAPVTKAKKMAIGTISHGRKKVAEGKWVLVKKDSPKKEKARKVVYSQGKYNTYTTGKEDMYTVIGNGHEDTVYSLKGAKMLIDRYVDMERLGFTSVSEYVKYKNVEYNKKIDKEVEAKDRVIKEEAEYKNTSHVDKPLYVNMEALQELSPMARGRVSKVLDKKYNTSEGILTLRELIESGKYVSKESGEVPKIQFNRSKYNRMDQKEQDVYEEKLKEKKTAYTIRTAKGTFTDVPKSVYGLISIGKKISTSVKKSIQFPDMSLIKSDIGRWYLQSHGMLTRFWWFHGLEKAIKTKTYYSPEEVKARGMRWVTIRGARVLIQGTTDGGWVVVGGAGGKLNHLKIDKILSKEEYAAKRKQVEKKRGEDLRKLSKEEMAEQTKQRKAEVVAKRQARAQYTTEVAEVLGITEDEIRSDITAKMMDELADKARKMVEARAKKPADLEGAVEDQTEKEIDKAVQSEVKNIERQALETLMNEYTPQDPNAPPDLKKLLDHDKALEVLSARKQFKQTMKEIGKGQADVATTMKVGDVLAGSSDSIETEILDEIKGKIETQKNIRLYDTLNAQSRSITKHVDQGAISALNGLIGDIYGTGATFSTTTVENLGLEAIVRAVTIKIQQDGKGDVVRDALVEYAENEREKVVTNALKESEKRFKNADNLRALARDTDDAEAILSTASANGHALKQLTAGQRALGTAVGSLRAVAGMINALEDPPADVVQIDVGKDLARARKKAKETGLPKGAYSIKTLKEGRAKRLVLELKKEELDTFFMRNENMRKDEGRLDSIKRHEANDGYLPPGIKEDIKFDPAQEAGLRFFMEQDNVILDFEAGLGKTGVAYAAIMEAMENRGAKKVLVVTPAKTRGDFKSQAKTFLEKDKQKLVVSSTENTSRTDRHARHNKEEGIHIISQDALREDAGAIKAAGYDMIVVDEIHEMTAGTGQAGRYKSLEQLSGIPLKIAMSGTNIKNKKKELYRKINFIDPDHTLGTMAEFEKRYKGLNQGTGMFSDAANDAFRKEVAQWVYTQKNVLPVENTVDTQRIPLTSEQRKKYAASERQYRVDRENKVPGASGSRDSRNYAIITDDNDQQNAKLNKIVDTMKNIHPGEKAVVHISRPGVSVLKAMETAERRLKTEFGENAVGTIHGKSSPGYVTNLKKRFNDPDDPLRFIVGTKSLESGHNLQGGGTVTFHLDLPDSYASFQQRNARVYRKGQDRDTKTYVLSGLNPYDMRGEDIMETKRKEMGIMGNPREVEAMDDTGFIGILNKREQEAKRAVA